MFPAARITDPVSHDAMVPSGVIGPSAPVPCVGCVSAPVIIEGMPAAHVLCTVVCSGAISGGLVHPPPPPPAPPPPITIGSLSVFIHGLPAARWMPALDMGACGCFLGLPLMAATRTVFIGDVGMGGAASPQGQAMQSARDAARPLCEICSDE